MINELQFSGPPISGDVGGQAPTIPGSEIRQRWIAEIAYHKAEKRGFEGGHELDDWLEAEAEADAAWFAES